jgi:hypothetical protein
MTTSPASPHDPGRPAAFRTLPELRELADRDRIAADQRAPEQLRLRYCAIRYAPSLADPRPCTSCGQPCSVAVDGVILHLHCPDPPARAAAQPQPAPGQAQDRTGDQLAGVLAADGLWLEGASAPVPVAWPASAGEAYKLAEQHGIRQLWIHPSAHEPLGLPAEHGGNPQAPQEHPWFTGSGYSCDPPGAAAWVQVQPDGEARRRAVVFPGYETRAPWAAATTGGVLLAAIGEIAAALPQGCSYYYSPNVTSAAVIRHHTAGKLTVTEMPPPATGRVQHIRRWSRPLTEAEAGAKWLHRYDTRGQQLAVWGVRLGLGAAEQVHVPVWTRDSRRTAGYWLTHLPPGWEPDPRLPDLLIPWRRAGADAAWLPTPYLELLDDLGAPLAIEEAWIWPTSSAWLEASGKTFRQARAAFVARDDEPARVAGGVIRAMYTSRIGAFSPHAPGKITELVRPDVTDQIVAKGFCNDYRRAMKIGKVSGRWPVAIYADAIYYAADDPDPVGGGKPDGLELGLGLGQYSWEESVPVAAVADRLGEAGFLAAVERYLRDRDEQLAELTAGAGGQGGS